MEVIELKNENMSNSSENNMMVIRADFANFARTLISNGTTTPEQATSQLLQKNPNFKTDEIFQKIFPIIFRIELCKALKSANKPQNS